MTEDSDIDTDNSALSAGLKRPLVPYKGRGAVSQLPGRYEKYITEAVDDGWWQGDDHDTMPRGVSPELTEQVESEGLIASDTGLHHAVTRNVLTTQIVEERAKTILTRNASPDLPFSVSLNPYRGCEHGCIYCFARPTHAYLGLSPGLDFETRLYAKVNAPELLRQELAHPSYNPLPIALGVNTDAYQPCEKHWQLTRRLLQILQECEHPVGLITKSALIERDLDILAELAQKQLAVAAITLVTLDHKMSRLLEPRAASPTRRLETIRRLAQAGIPVSVSVAPVIPFITEQDMERVLAAAAEAGATGAGYTVIRLPWEVNPLFQEWLAAHFPDRAQRVMNRIRDMRGGEDYVAEFGARMRGEGVWADLIRQRFEKALQRLNIKHQSRFCELDCSRFRRPRDLPPRRKYGDNQSDLFE